MSNAQNPRAQAAKEHPNAWIPVEAGDTLEGVVTDVTRAWSDQRAKNGDGFYPLLRVQTDDGVTLDFHAFTVVSYNQVMEHQPIPGERIIITYQGEGKAKDGNNAPRIFHVRLPERDPRAAANSVYSRLGADRLVNDLKSNAPPAELTQTDDQTPLPF